jgi:hypothetical protein
LAKPPNRFKAVYDETEKQLFLSQFEGIGLVTFRAALDNYNVTRVERGLAQLMSENTARRILKQAKYKPKIPIVIDPSKRPTEEEYMKLLHTKRSAIEFMLQAMLSPDHQLIIVDEVHFASTKSKLKVYSKPGHNHKILKMAGMHKLHCIVAIDQHKIVGLSAQSKT